MIQEMNRRDYIRRLDALRDDVIEIGKRYANALLAGAKEIEKERQKKTGKLFCDLATRLFEDAAVTLKILEANEAAGIGEQAVFDFNTESAPTPEQKPDEAEQTADADKPVDETPAEEPKTAKPGKGKRGKKGGAA
jgi:hypothetical protein